jgi:hypothetical protein
MVKFTEINESKNFLPDPSIIKKYASFIIPLYLQGELPCDVRLIDEWLQMNNSKEKEKNRNMVCDLEIKAIRNIFSNPLTFSGYNELKVEIEKKCPKLEIFLRKFYQKKFEFE